MLLTFLSFKFLSTLSLRRATLTTVLHWYHINISIHALLAESDCSGRSNSSAILTFLSTLSLRRATLLYHFCPVDHKHFYPRSPCGERPQKRLKKPCITLFLSTLSLRRATGGLQILSASIQYFYPRSPCGERLANIYETVNRNRISIHALLAESDFDFTY